MEAAQVMKFLSPKGRITRLLGTESRAPFIDLKPIFDGILLHDTRFPMKQSLRDKGWYPAANETETDSLFTQTATKPGASIWKHSDYPLSYLATWQDTSVQMASYQAILICQQFGRSAFKKIASDLQRYKCLFEGRHPVTQKFNGSGLRNAWRYQSNFEHSISASFSANSVGFRYATKLNFFLLDTSHLSKTLFPQGVGCVHAQRDYEWR